MIHIMKRIILKNFINISLLSRKNFINITNITFCIEEGETCKAKYCLRHYYLEKHFSTFTSSNTIEKKNALAAEIKVEHIQEKIYEYRNNALRITIKNGITSQKNENVKLNYCDL